MVVPGSVELRCWIRMLPDDRSTAWEDAARSLPTTGAVSLASAVIDTYVAAGHPDGRSAATAPSVASGHRGTN